MELNQYFKSIIEQDTCSVVICDMNHTMIYLNPAAIKNYEKYGGAKLWGKSLFDCHNQESNEKIKKVVDWFKQDKSHNIVHTYYQEDKFKDEYMVALRDDDGNLIGYYEKHEIRKIDTTPFYDMK